MDPAICTPPIPPQPGQPGYGSGNPYNNGVYYDPGTGFWFVPDGLWDGETGGRMIEVIDEIEELIDQSWPYWATSDAWEGKYWYYGGWSAHGNWYAEGYYYAHEIW